MRGPSSAAAVGLPLVVIVKRANPGSPSTPDSYVVAAVPEDEPAVEQRAGGFPFHPFFHPSGEIQGQA